MTTPEDANTVAGGPPIAPGVKPHAEKRLREAVNNVMHYQFTHSRPGMHALQVLIDEADDAAYELEHLRARVLELEAAHEDASGAVLQERERCAKLCEREAQAWRDVMEPNVADCINAVADVMRGGGAAYKQRRT